MIDLIFFLIALFVGIMFGCLLGYCLALVKVKSYMERNDKTGGF